MLHLLVCSAERCLSKYIQDITEDVEEDDESRR